MGAPLARPRNYYVLLALGGLPEIIHGQEEARRRHAQSRPFRTKWEAEEWAADWWMETNHTARRWSEYEYRARLKKDAAPRTTTGVHPDFIMRIF